ncbi:hypothetical protein Golomagni_06103, partial [Golovinomyces magnicellulatus]
TFINSPVLFKNTERPVFSAIQTKLFPIYFGIQTVAPVILGLTFPGNALFGISSGIHGLLEDSNRWGSLLPVAASFVSGLLNLLVLLPASREVMKQRQGQAKRDGKQWHEPGEQSAEMKRLSKKFGMLHGISSLLNLGTFIAAVAYGFTLGSRIQTIADRL